MAAVNSWKIDIEIGSVVEMWVYVALDKNSKDPRRPPADILTNKIDFEAFLSLKLQL